MAGEIIGAVIGGILLGVILISIVWCYWMSKLLSSRQ